jgi:hypothetical protein
MSIGLVGGTSALFASTLRVVSASSQVVITIKKSQARRRYGQHSPATLEETIESVA